MFGHWGIGEILVVLIAALLLFGPRRLPEIGKALGNGIREFRDSFSGNGPQPPKTGDVGPIEGPDSGKTSDGSGG